MGQKVNPISLRLQKTNRHFDSCWYDDYNYTHLLLQDYKIKNYLKTVLQQIKYPEGRIINCGLPKKNSYNLFYYNPSNSRRKKSLQYQLQNFTEKKSTQKAKTSNTPKHPEGMSGSVKSLVLPGISKSGFSHPRGLPVTNQRFVSVKKKKISAKDVHSFFSFPKQEYWKSNTFTLAQQQIEGLAGYISLAEKVLSKQKSVSHSKDLKHLTSHTPSVTNQRKVSVRSDVKPTFFSQSNPKENLFLFDKKVYPSLTNQRFVLSNTMMSQITDRLKSRDSDNVKKTNTFSQGNEKAKESVSRTLSATSTSKYVKYPKVYCDKKNSFFNINQLFLEFVTKNNKNQGVTSNIEKAKTSHTYLTKGQDRQISDLLTKGNVRSLVLSGICNRGSVKSDVMRSNSGVCNSVFSHPEGKSSEKVDLTQNLERFVTKKVSSPLAMLRHKDSVKNLNSERFFIRYLLAQLYSNYLQNKEYYNAESYTTLYRFLVFFQEKKVKNGFFLKRYRRSLLTQNLEFVTKPVRDVKESKQKNSEIVPFTNTYQNQKLSQFENSLLRKEVSSFSPDIRKDRFAMSGFLGDYGDLGVHESGFFQSAKNNLFKITKSDVQTNKSRKNPLYGRSGVYSSNLVYKSHLEFSLSKQYFSLFNINLFRTLIEKQSASFLVQEIIYYLERKIPFRRIKTQILKEIPSYKNIKGIRIKCSGRVGGRSKKAQRSKTQSVKIGQTSLGVFSSKIDFACKSAYTRFGLIGVKVWVCYQ